MGKLKRELAVLMVGLLLSFSAVTTVRADLQAFVGSDTVELTDGTKIQCLILMESSRGVLVVMPDPEKGEDAYRQQFIPASRIERVVRGERQGETRAFQTNTELARKVIQGSGFRPAEKAPNQPVEPVTPTGPIAPATPPVTVRPAPKPAPAVGRGALPPKDLAEAYLQRFPALEEAAHLLGGRAQLADSLGKAFADPAARQETGRLLELFLAPVEAEQPRTAPRKKKVKPAPRTAKRPPATTRK